MVNLRTGSVKSRPLTAACKCSIGLPIRITVVVVVHASLKETFEYGRAKKPAGWSGHPERELTLAGEAEGALEGLQARDRLLGVALAEAVVGEEAGIVLDRAVQLVAADCRRRGQSRVSVLNHDHMKDTTSIALQATHRDRMAAVEA